MEFLSGSWPWYVGGPMLSLVMFLMIVAGSRFGVSSSMETICSLGGAGKLTDYFNFNWKDQSWSLVFIIGVMLGGFFSRVLLTGEVAIELSEATKASLIAKGFENPGSGYLPEFFTWENLLTFRGFLFMVGGGFLVGFGTRYAGGCTSGHGIAGLSDFQLPSLLAVIGFFIGGLILTHLVIPYVL